MNSLKNIHRSCSEYISLFLHIAQQKLDEEIKGREAKYSELDSKLSRLHKRAKQRIQDIQKVKAARTFFSVSFSLCNMNAYAICHNLPHLDDNLRIKKYHREE